MRDKNRNLKGPKRELANHSDGKSLIKRQGGHSTTLMNRKGLVNGPLMSTQKNSGPDDKKSKISKMLMKR